MFALMLACPLFRKFREPNKTAKLKGANINCGPKIGRSYYNISNYMVLIRQNNFACKVSNFYRSQIKEFYSSIIKLQCVAAWCSGAIVHTTVDKLFRHDVNLS